MNPPAIQAPARPAAAKSRPDVLAWPVAGRFLRWRHARSALQIPLLFLAALMVWHGLTGPDLAPKNLSTVLTWVHYRGILVALLVAAGNVFCMACPFMIPRELARRFAKPARLFPPILRNKWPGVILLVGVLFAYELFDLWGSPWWTAWLIVGYFAAAVVVDSFFRGASFCKYVCPIGQFNFVASTMSPLEVAMKDRDVCAKCKTHDCLRGKFDSHGKLVQRGCELALFIPKKVGNTDCTFCLDCIHACPHNNVAITTRIPASDLLSERNRSGVGRIFKRKDLAALSIVFVFGALLNAFGMVSPVYAVQQWMASTLGVRHEAPILGILFLVALVVEPFLLLGGAALATHRLTRTRGPVLPTAIRFTYALIPFGFGMWVAHYGFHFLTGMWTFVPVLQSALADAEIPLLGAPRWELGGLSVQAVYPIEIAALTLGLLGSLVTAYRLASSQFRGSPREAFVPWAMVGFILWASAIWLLSQPMEMRASFLGS
jgi:ferredoxin